MRLRGDHRRDERKARAGVGGDAVARDDHEQQRSASGEEEGGRRGEPGQHGHQHGRSEHGENVLGAEPDRVRPRQPLIGRDDLARPYLPSVAMKLPNTARVLHLVSPPINQKLSTLSGGPSTGRRQRRSAPAVNHPAPGDDRAPVLTRGRRRPGGRWREDPSGTICVPDGRGLSRTVARSPSAGRASRASWSAARGCVISRSSAARNSLVVFVAAPISRCPAPGQRSGDLGLGLIAHSGAVVLSVVKPGQSRVRRVWRPHPPTVHHRPSSAVEANRTWAPVRQRVIVGGAVEDGADPRDLFPHRFVLVLEAGPLHSCSTSRSWAVGSRTDLDLVCKPAGAYGPST